MNYIAVRGKGDPNVEGGAYKTAIGLLYAVAYTIKMSKKGDHKIDGYFDFVVPPLEGFWWQDGVEGVDYAHKEEFNWISVIRLPDFVTEEEFRWAVEEAARKKGSDADGDGDGGVFEIDYKAGGRILPFTILHATVLQIRGGLDVHAEYNKIKKDNEYAEAMFLYGIGATYYIYPHNFFVTSSLGMVSFGLPEDSGKREARSEFGFGFQLGFGKEWWVSENWGIGASFAVNCGSVDEDEEDFEFSAFAITLMLTATYN